MYKNIESIVRKCSQSAQAAGMEVQPSPCPGAVEPRFCVNVDFSGRFSGQLGSSETLDKNGEPQFSSEILNFCLNNAVRHIPSPYCYPQSNCQGERLVDVLKPSLMKSQGKCTMEEVIQNFLRVREITPNVASPNSAFSVQSMFKTKTRNSVDSM